MLHETAVLALAFSSDSLLLASGCKEGNIKVKNRAINKTCMSFAINKTCMSYVIHDIRVVFSCILYPFRCGNSQVVNVSRNSIRHMIKVTRRLQIISHSNDFDFHSGVSCLTFNLDNSQLLSGSLDHTAR